MQKKSIPIKAHPNLIKDVETGAIISNDSLSYTNVLKQRRRRKTQQSELDQMRSMIAELQKKINNNKEQ